MNQLLFAAPLLAGVLTIAGCSMLGKVDRSRWYSRDGWSLPEGVITTLGISPGMRVADIGAGDGYFTFRFAEAVGRDGQVYAVELADSQVSKLEQKAVELGYTQVRAVRGDTAMPNLADGSIDIAFFSGVFHHIGDPGRYFGSVRRALAPDGRIAIIDGAPDPLHAMFMPFHFSSAEQVAAVMDQAGFERTQSFDLLPMMNFQVFAPRR